MTYNDKFGYHEVIHTTHVILCMWDDHILGHGVVDLDEPELKVKAEKISELMAEFYQEISNRSDENFNEEG